MDHSTAFAIANLASSTVGAVKNAVDLSAKVDNRDLKHELSEIMNGLLKMQAALLELDAENRDLREKLKVHTTIKRSGEFGYYFLEGDDDPHCPKCYEDQKKLSHLTAAKPWGGGIRRDCRICSWISWEKPMQQRPRGSVSTFRGEAY